MRNRNSKLEAFFAKVIAEGKLPETIEDEIPPMSEAFHKKVKAEGGRITAQGIVYDQPKKGA